MARNIFMLALVAAFGFFLASCEKDPVEDRLNQEVMIINNNSSQLGQRVKTIAGGRLMPVYPVGADGNFKSMKTGSLSMRYEIYLRAEVDPPVHEGKTLQASHIKIVGNTAFVTYNTRGGEYLGGVDVFDVSDIENPLLIQGVIFPEKDISSIDVDPKGDGENNFIYLTGARNLSLDPLRLGSPAIVEKFIANKANQFKHLDEPRLFFDLESFAGNDVRYNENNSVYVTSGSDGGLSILNNAMKRTEYIPIPYARSIDTDGTHLVVYSAEDNRLLVMNMKGEVLRVITTGGNHFEGDDYLEAKSIVRLKDNLVFVAAGTGGMEVYDINTGGDPVASLPRPVEHADADFPLDYVTNGVSVNENLILIANGGSGVHIAEIDNENRVSPIGKWKFEMGSSANFVEARDNKIFVATGLGGLKILEIVELEPTVPCATLWPTIVEYFPEKKNIHHTDHPAHELSATGLPGTITLIEDGPVYITFIHNGAGWDNRFGYYAYPGDEVPLSSEDLDKNIIYNYVNKNSNGQSRQQGERVRLGADNKIFPAGTVIGFYIIADGWDKDLNEPKMEPRHTVYTTPEFNPENVRKHVLFLEADCGNIVLGFEDMLAGSDEDFNDIIFTISNGYDIWGNEHNDFLDQTGLPVIN